MTSHNKLHTMNTSPRPAAPAEATHPLPTASSRRERPSAFTLIELLVVIAIIAILAGLAFPAVQGALGQGKKAQARNDVNQLATAIKAYQLEYGKLPIAAAGGDSIGADNKTIVGTLVKSNALNPRGIVFFEPKIAKGNKGGMATDNTLYDPWGMAYRIDLDTSYDNRITTDVGASNQTYLTTVIVQSAGPDTNMTARTDNISNVK